MGITVQEVVMRVLMDCAYAGLILLTGMAKIVLVANIHLTLTLMIRSASLVSQGIIIQELNVHPPTVQQPIHLISRNKNVYVLGIVLWKKMEPVGHVPKIKSLTVKQVGVLLAPLTHKLLPILLVVSVIQMIKFSHGIYNNVPAHMHDQYLMKKLNNVSNAMDTMMVKTDNVLIVLLVLI